MDLRMKEIRTQRGLGQKEVAAKAGMPIRRYGSYERGERTISLEDAALIVDVFGCTMDELVGRTAPSSHPSPSPDESRLLSLYRSMDATEQQRLMAVAESFAMASEKYAGAARRAVRGAVR